jgi:hypothetical protein
LLLLELALLFKSLKIKKYSEWFRQPCPW